MLVGTASIADRRLLVVTTVLSAALHLWLGVAVLRESTWAFGMSGRALPAVEQAPLDDVPIEIAETIDQEPPEPPPLRLGIEESEGDTKTWLGFSEPEEHLVPVASEVEQAALTPDDVGGMLAGVPDAEGMEPAPETTEEIASAEQQPPVAKAGDAAADEAAETTEAKTRDVPNPATAPEPLPESEPETKPETRPEERPESNPDPVPLPRPEDATPSDEAVEKAPGEVEKDESDTPTAPISEPTPGAEPAVEPTAEPAAPAPAPKPPPVVESVPRAQPPSPIPASVEPSAKPEPAPGPAPGPTTGNGAAPGLGEGEALRRGMRSDKESPAAALKRAVKYRPGKPLAVQGLEVRTVEPRFPVAVRLTSSPRNPVVTIHFDRRGVVTRAEFLKDDEKRIIYSTGTPAMDEPLLTAIYQWRAKGRELEALPADDPEATVSFVMEIYLTR